MKELNIKIPDRLYAELEVGGKTKGFNIEESVICTIISAMYFVDSVSTTTLVTQVPEMKKYGEMLGIDGLSVVQRIMKENEAKNKK